MGKKIYTYVCSDLYSKLSTGSVTLEHKVGDTIGFIPIYYSVPNGGITLYYVYGLEEIATIGGVTYDTKITYDEKTFDLYYNNAPGKLTVTEDTEYTIGIGFYNGNNYEYSENKLIIKVIKPEWKQDDAAFALLLDPNGGTFKKREETDPDPVTEYWSTEAEEAASPYVWKVWVEDSSKEGGGSWELPTFTLPDVEPPSGMALCGWRTIPEYRKYEDTTKTINDIEMRRYNLDTVLTTRIFPEWRPNGTERAKAYLSSQKDVREDTLQIPYLDLGFVQTITETYKSQLSVTAIMTYDSRSSFAFDTGVTKTMSLQVKRTQINTPKDTSSDSSEWSNTKWLHALKAFVDRWQMGTDGCQFFLSIPNSTSDPNYMYTEYGSIDGGVNCYLSSLAFNYSNELPNGIEATIPITFGTMHPKKEKAAVNQMTFKVDSYEISAEYGLDALAENVDFKVPDYLWGGLPKQYKTTKYIYFSHWYLADDPTGQYNYYAGDVIKAGSKILAKEGMVFTAVLGEEAMENVQTAVSNNTEFNYVRITNSLPSKVEVTIFISAGGGGGGGAGGGYQNDLSTDRKYYGYGGNGGASGEFLKFTIEIEGNKTRDYPITIGAGGAGGTGVIGENKVHGGRGGQGGNTTFRVGGGALYEVTGGSGGYCRSEMGGDFSYYRDDFQHGYNAGGYGGQINENNDLISTEKINGTSDWWQRGVLNRQGMCGEDRNHDSSSVLETIYTLRCGFTGVNRTEYDNASEEVQSKVRIVPYHVEGKDSEGKTVTHTYWIATYKYQSEEKSSGYVKQCPQYHYFVGIKREDGLFDTVHKYYSNGGGGGAPYIPDYIAEWLAAQSIHPIGGNGSANRDWSGMSEDYTGYISGTRCNNSEGWYSGGGGGGGYMWDTNSEGKYEWSNGTNGGNGFIWIRAALGENGSIEFIKK